MALPPSLPPSSIAIAAAAGSSRQSLRINLTFFPPSSSLPSSSFPESESEDSIKVQRVPHLHHQGLTWTDGSVGPLMISVSKQHETPVFFLKSRFDAHVIPTVTFLASFYIH